LQLKLLCEQASPNRGLSVRGSAKRYNFFKNWKMSDNSRRARKSKRPRTKLNREEGESLFTDVTVPLSLSLPQAPQPRDEPDFGEEFLSSVTEATSSTSPESLQPGDLSHVSFHMHFPMTSTSQSSDDERELDSMWNDVPEAIIAESDERDLRDWSESTEEEEEEEEEEEDGFEEVTDEMTLDETINIAMTNAKASSTPPMESKTSSDGQQALYPGAKVSIGAVMVLLTLYAIKYDLTGEAITHLLQFISLILPAGNILPGTLRKFKSYFRKLDSPVILHHYCSYCLSYVNKQVTSCPNPACMKELSSRNVKAYFIEIPVVHQLAAFFLVINFTVTFSIVFIIKKNIPTT